MQEIRSKEDILKEYREAGITDAVRKVIAQEGFAALTIERVAETAQISKGTIYLYFKNKEELIRASVVDTLRIVHDHLVTVIASADDFPGKLRALVRVQLEQIEAHHAFFRALMTERSFLHCEREDDPILERQWQFVKTITELMELGKASGHVRPGVSSEEAAFFLLHHIQGTALRHVNGFLLQPLADADRQIIDFLLNGIGTHGEF